MRLNFQHDDDRKSYTTTEAWDGKAEVINRRTETRTPHRADKEFTKTITFNIIEIRFDPQRDTTHNLIALAEKEYQQPGAYVKVNGRPFSKADIQLVKDLESLELDQAVEELIEETELQEA